MSRRLFEGVRFWVHDDVPMRDRWIEDIQVSLSSICLIGVLLLTIWQNHGGILTQDMNTADLRIADHMKKAGRNPPENAVSYKFIAQSVKSGVLEDVESHRITGAVGHPAAAKTSSKGKKVPFTTSDDQTLSHWVAKKEREGEALMGNKIFQELEAICPHHTWQSWRSRYANYKNLLPKPKVSTAEPANQASTRNAPIPASIRRQEPPPPPAPRRKSPPVAGTRRLKFTEEDDQLLLEYVEEVGENKSGNKIYQVLAEEHPHHSWHSWRDRYVRHLEPRLRAEAAEKEHVPPAAGPRQQTSQPATRTKSGEHRPAAPSVAEAARPVASSNGIDEDEDFPSIGDIIARKASLNTLVDRQTSAQSAVIRDHDNAAGLSWGAEPIGGLSAEEVDLRLAKIELSRLLQTHGRGYLVRSALRQLDHYLPHLQAHSRGVLLRSKLRDFFDEDLVRLQAHANGALVRIALRPEQQDNDGNESTDEFEEQTAEEMTPRPSRQPITPKEDFYALLNGYLEATGADINQWPKIQGRTLELWELWHTVKSLDQGRSPSVRNWEQIAETLGFDWIETPEVTLQLKKCYEASLGEFEALQEAFEAEDLGSQAEQESDQSVAGSDTAMEVADPKLPNASLPFHSSPPRILGQKRAFEPDPASSSADLGFSPAKRMRYTKDIEIPSSPEAEQAAAAATAGPSWKERLLPDRRRAAVVTSVEHNIPPRSSLKRLPQSPVQPAKAKSELDSPADPSPSQQLHIENEDLSPIPFPGFKLRDVPYRSPLGSRLNSSSNQLKAVRGSTTAKPTNGAGIIISSIERQAQVPREDSPVEAKAKRRSLPASFHRAVSPPTSGVKVPSAAPARVSLPAAAAAKRTAPVPRVFSNNVGGPSPGTSTTNKTKARSRTTVSPAAPRVLLSGPIPPKDFSLAQTMDYYTSLGYRRSHIIEAFKATLAWGLAAVVMQELKEGRGIPDNWEGVWSAQDDADLRYVLRVEQEMEGRRTGGAAPGREDRDRVRRAERSRRRLEAKHGPRRVRDREMSFMA